MSQAADPVEEIKARVDLADYIGRRVQLRRAGRDLKGLCPFHQEKSPSFVVHPQEQYWHCFGCGRSGDLLAFVQEMESLDFRGALELLGAEAGVQIAPGRPGTSRLRQDILAVNAQAAQFYAYVLSTLPAGEAGRAFLEERGVSAETAEKFGLGYAPGGRADLYRYLVEKKGHAPELLGSAGLAHVSAGRPPLDRFRRRVVFPVRDPQGRVLGFSARLVGPERDREPKYLNTPETAAYHKGDALYGLDQARPAARRDDVLVLVEGNLDCVSAHQAGIDNVVAMCGTSLTESQAKLIKRHARELILALDSDEAGEAATARAVEVAARAGLDVRVLELPGVKDPDEFIRADGAPMIRWRDAQERAPREWAWMLDRIFGSLDLGSTDGRRLGARRATALLAKIPEPATRQIYAQEAASRLGVDPANLLQEAKLSRPERVLPSGPQHSGPGLAARRPGNKPIRSMDLLLAALARTPGLAEGVISLLDSVEVEETGREALEVIARAAADGATLEERAAQLSGPVRDRLDQALAWRPPREWSGEQEAAQVVEECLRALRQESLQVKLREANQAVEEAEDRGDTAAVAARLVEARKAASELKRLRRVD